MHVYICGRYIFVCGSERERERERERESYCFRRRKRIFHMYTCIFNLYVLPFENKFIIITIIIINTIIIIE